MVTYENCPLCGSGNIHFVLNAQDHTVSGEVFEVWECGECTARFTQNVPEADNIGRYYQSENYISHSNTSEGLVNKLYHQVRKITLTQKRKLVQKVTGLQKGNLLDIGAGTGLFAEAMRGAGWNVTALEPDETARKKAAEMNIILEDAQRFFQLPAASFDAITMWHVLEHVHEVHKYLEQAKQLSKSTGVIIIAVPNYISTDAKTYGAYWAAYDVPRHLYHFSPGAMRTLLKKHGFTLHSMHPQWFDSFYVSMLSEQYKTGKSSLVKGGWHGLRSNVNAMTAANKCSSVIYVFTIKP
jgi:2-polyprenyl-3-methyl-5-hydroxy-6-metoxy-1,4-benzoquinol methylase